MRQVLALILCLGAWPFLVSLTGCASHRSNPRTDQRVGDTPNPSTDQHVGDTPNPVTDQRIEDNRTAERVREALAAAPKYRYDGVQVAVARGVVHLSGFVNTKAQKNSAGEITTKLVGVKSVENNIAVKD
jgi:osmotically-inducible protein OsmY